MNTIPGPSPTALGPPTRFAGLPRVPAALALILLVVAILACEALLTRAGPPGRGAAPRGGDLAMYRAVVGRVAAGEGYYEALGDEARRGGYGTRSVFNWRPPLHLWALAHLPGPSWRAGALGVLAVLAGAATFAGMERDGGFPVAATWAVLAAPALALSAVGTLFAEGWAGLLILMAAGLSATRWRGLAVAAGISALFLRELAAPYVVVAAWLAWRAGGRGECSAWAVGVAAFAGYFALHALQVTSRISEADVAYPSGWVQWGGPAFVLRATTFGFLGLLPAPVAATAIPLALLGMIGWRGELGARVALTTASYLAAFGVVGKPFNDYWGLMVSPLLYLGLAWVPAALRDLVRASLGSGPG